MELINVKPIFMKYLSNCILLIIPVILWNIIFASRLPKEFLPEIFWNNIPAKIRYGENFFRIVVFALPLFMPLNLAERIQKFGLIIYALGIIIYFASWIPLLFFPELSWSSSMIGFLAPALTPVIFAVGIGLIGNRLYLPIPYHFLVYIISSVIFVFFHCWHVLTVYQRIY